MEKVKDENKNLVCKDCIHRFDGSKFNENTSKCKMFTELKPKRVLDGKDCALYENILGERV